MSRAESMVCGEISTQADQYSVSAGSDNMAGDSKVVCPTGDFIVNVLAGWREFQNFSRQLGYFDRREVLCIYLRYGSRETLHMDQD